MLLYCIGQYYIPLIHRRLFVLSSNLSRGTHHNSSHICFSQVVLSWRTDVHNSCFHFIPPAQPHHLNQIQFKVHVPTAQRHKQLKFSLIDPDEGVPPRTRLSPHRQRRRFPQTRVSRRGISNPKGEFMVLSEEPLKETF